MSDHTSSYRLGGSGPEYTVVLKDGLEPQQLQAGLYRVTCDERDRRLEVSRTDAITTRNAAVNGIQNDLDRAAFVMFDKVSATSELRRDATPTEFTLYHVPTRGLARDVALTTAEITRQTTDDAKGLAGALESSARSGPPVVWSVHSRGAVVFDMAARDCARRGVSLQNESVAVYNGAANEMVMDHDLRDAGITKLGPGYFNHPGDPVPQIIGSNTRNPVKVVAALANAGPVMFASQSVHTWHVPLTPREFDSIPLAQWERPGVDLRENPPPVPPRPSRSPSAPRLDTATIRAAGIDEKNPTFRVLCEAIGARQAYEQGSAIAQTRLLGVCRQAFQRDVSGPDLSGVPLRAAALDYVKGDGSAEVLLGAALKHSAAVQREQSLARVATTADLTLDR